MESIEQQIYTNLAFEGPRAGHQTRATTEGIDAAMQGRIERICDGWGVYEPGTEFDHALVQIPLWELAPPPAGPSHYLLILTTHKGRDRHGRPGAVLRHIVRVPASQHAQLEYHPFRFHEQGHLLDAWEPGVPLPDIVPVPGTADAGELQLIFPEHYPRLRKLLAQLLDSGSVQLPVDADSREIDHLFAQLVTLVPLAVRRQLSLATYAFRNAGDYAVASFRHEGASVRKALEDIDAGPEPDTAPAVARYLDDLFARLENRDWVQALQLIATTHLPVTLAPHPRAIHPRLREQPAETSGPDTAPGDTPPAAVPSSDAQAPAAAARPSSDTVSHHPHWQKAAAEERKRRSAAIWLVIPALVVIAAAAWFLVPRGGQEGPAGRGPLDRFIALRGDGVGALLDRHEQELGRILADDVRDLDLREAMAAASASLPTRLRESLTADLRRLDRSLGRPDEDPRAFADAAAAFTTWATTSAAEWQRAAVLEQLLADADPAALRSRFDAEARLVSLLPSGEPGAPPSAAAELRSVTAALERAAAGLGTMVTAEAGANDTWQSAADELDAALAMIPDGIEAPRAITAAAALARAQSALHRAEDEAGLQALASRVPYSGRLLQRGPLAAATSALTGAIHALETVGIQPPASTARVAAFYALAADERVASGAAASARSLLGELAAACGAEADLPCRVAPYGRHLDRWRLEAWRTLGGPTSAAGQELIDELGDTVLPAPVAATASFVPLLTRMVDAGQPASAALVDEVRGASGTVPDLFAEICRDWLARNRRQADGQRTAFTQIYDRLQSRLSQLREADDASGPAAYAALSQAVAELDGVDLGSLMSQPAQRRQAAAADQLRRQVRGRHLVGISRIDLELLRSRDYTGQLHRTAQPRLMISAVQGNSRTPLSQFMASELTAVAGAGFPMTTIETSTKVPMKPDDTLLVTGFEADGATWFHFYVDAPPRGHTAAALAGLHEVKVTATAMQSVVEQPDRPLPRSQGGDPIATVRIVLAGGFWAELGQSFPDLP